MAGYVGHGEREEREMLAAIGVSSFEELLPGVPAAARLRGAIDIPPGQSEHELRALLQGYGKKNYDPEAIPSFLGAGLYDHVIPAAIRQLTLRSEFYTAYTPYQPEVAQGTLAAIYEFQSIMTELLGMDVANASVYDAGSGVAEGALLAASATGRKRIALAATLHPHWRSVIETYADGPGLELVSLPAAADGRIDPAAARKLVDESIGAIVVQSPNFFGCIEELAPLCALAHEKGALAIAVANLASLGLLEAPGVSGADVAVAEAQCYGNPPQYGGPLCGVLAAKKDLVRRLPGRLVAEAKDQDGHRGFVLTLQTREQHIRRDKATSNICTNNSLVALGVTIYFSLLGPDGLREVAGQCLRKARYLYDLVTRVPGVKAAYAAPFFQEFTLELPVPAGAVVERMLREEGILAGLDLGRIDPAARHRLLVAVTEKRTRAELDRYAEALRRSL